MTDRERVIELESELADIRLELACPENAGTLDKEPLYKSVATIVCGNILLKQENKQLRRLIQIKCQAFCDFRKIERDKVREECQELERILKTIED